MVSQDFDKDLISLSDEEKLAADKRRVEAEAAEYAERRRRKQKKERSSESGYEAASIPTGPFPS